MSYQKNKSKSKSRLLFIFHLFISFSMIERAGHLSRMLQRFDAYSKSFEKVYIKSYENKQFKDLPDNVIHIPFLSIPFRRYFYLFFSEFLKYKKVDYVEIEDTRAIITAFIYKLTGAKIFLHHRWSSTKLLENERPLFAFLTNIIDILAFKIADTIAVTTKRLGDDVKRHTRKDKIYLLQEYVDIDCFKRHETIKVHNLLIFVGRLHPEKNLHTLLNVMKELPEFKLWIIGDGPLRDEFITLKNKNKIKNVKFLGVIPNEELPNYLNIAESFIIVSHREGHPRALIEAMACELPCIGTNVDGIKDVIIDGKTGLLCGKNKGDIKRCILELFSNGEKMKEMGRVARRLAVENYSMNKLIERRIKLIKGDVNDINTLYKD